MPAPRDVNGNVLPILRPRNGGTKVLTNATAGQSTRTVGAFDALTVAIGVRTSGEIRYRLGDDTVAALATDHKLLSTDGQRLISIDNRDAKDTFLAVWPIGGAATVEVEEFW